MVSCFDIYDIIKTIFIEEFDNIDIDYIEIDWSEENNKLKCVNAHHGNLFMANPQHLYINWAAAMQIQFHVSDLDQ